MLIVRVRTSLLSPYLYREEEEEENKQKGSEHKEQVEDDDDKMDNICDPYYEL